MTHSICWNCGVEVMPGLEADRRAVWWQFRVRLYRSAAGDEPQADSDPELDPGAMGTLRAAGLKGVADTVIQMAVAFHETAQLKGMDTMELDRRIPGLRPTLSRRKGNAVWRIPYDTLQSWAETGGKAPGWLARVDLERCESVTVATADPESPKPKFRRNLP